MTMMARRSNHAGRVHMVNKNAEVKECASSRMGSEAHQLEEDFWNDVRDHLEDERSLAQSWRS